MRQYSSYKCIEGSWIIELPTEWKTARLKTCVNLITERAENNNGYIGLENIESWTGKYTSKKKNEAFEAEGTSISIHKGNVLFGKLRPYLAKCYVAEAEGCCSTEFIVMDPKGIDSTFLKYLILSPSFIDYVNMSTYGSKMPRANWGFVGNMVIPIPNEEDQRGIVSYLNHKIGKIDALIDEAKASIEELKQWKASIIYEAVTKGLNPSAEMVDSGVEWIGKMPSNWDVSKAKYVVDISHGTDPKTEGNIPVYGSGSSSFKTCGEYKEGPTVLVGRKGATLHIPHYVEGKYWNVDTAFDVKSKTSSFLLKYYYYLATCFDYRCYMSQTTLPGMTQTNYNAMKLPIPKVEEQTRIVNYLDERCSLIRDLVSEKESLVFDLEGYKKSLIFEVVTGKRKVV